MEFHFMRPQWLLLIVPALLLAAGLWYQRDRAGSWQSVIAPHLLKHLVSEESAARSFNALPFIVLAWLLAVVAASGPSWEKLPQPVHQKQDALVILLDLSYSMKSGDLAPSRKDRARQKLLDLMAKRKEGQTGLIAYAGDAHIVTPLTDDTQTIANLLPALNPDMMPVPGSNPASATAQGLDLLRSAGIAGGRLLLVTDELTRDDADDIADLLEGQATTLSIMSVGTATGAPIPLPRGGFLKDGDGDIVMPGVDTTHFRSLATDTHGRYMAMQIDDSDLDFLLAQSPLLLDEQTIALDRTADAWEDQGYLFLLPLLPLVLALFRRGWLLQLLPAAVLVTLLLPAQPTHAQGTTWDNLWQTPDQQGRAALDSGNTERAAELFETPQWSGTAEYLQEDFEAAAEAFAEDASADGWYNRANALARAGQLDNAIAAYKESLKLAPGREDAEQNLALVEKLREQQEQQEQQQQNQEGDPQDQEGQEDNQEKQDGEQNPQEQESSSESGENSQADQENQERQSGDQQASSDSPPEDSEQEETQQSRSEEQAEQQAAEQQPPMNVAPLNPDELERDQAMEQWLRRVPDDPSGLLREKFRYESQLRQQQNQQKRGKTTTHEKNW